MLHLVYIKTLLHSQEDVMQGNVSNTSLHQQQSKVVGMQSERANQCTKQMSNGFWLGNPEREGSKTGRLKVSLDNQSADN